MKRLSIALLVGVLGLTAQPAVASAAEAGAPISPDLVAELDAKGTTKFMVYLRERANLSGAAKQATSDAKATHVYQQLTGTAKASQADLLAELDERKTPYRSFWIANAVQVTGDESTVDAIAARPDVERIEPSRSYPLLTATPAKAPERGTAATEWNVDNVRAPEVWSQYETRGEGIVVATIDSGAQYDHPALVNQYRGNLGNGSFDHNYNWFDPAGVCGSPAPCDNEDHGTHVAGTAVGDDGGANGIGVAPGAKWIAAKGCEDRNCTDASLLSSGQWVLAPTDLNGANPRPDLHPDVVNNSWGGGQNDPWYRQTIAAWTAAGIFPSFAVGNAGPGCNTANSPGDEPGAYAVGGHDINNSIYVSSSRGTSAVDGGTKPDISAPAVNVRSSVPGGLYAAFNGTSMATPHVSGTVALIWAAAPALKGNVAATRNVLDRTAIDVDSTGCGGTAADNNNFGEGRLDAFAAVTRAIRRVGEVTGVVTDAAGKPLAGATVSGADETATTAANGSYSLSLPIGEQQVTAALYGYRSETVTVTVPENGTVTANFDLDAASTVHISGFVFDASGHGWPLAARIDIAGRPGGPIYTDPATGLYGVGLASGATYRFTFTSLIPGYQTLTRDVTVGESNGKVDARLPVDPGCTAPGYQASFAAPTVTESFDGTTAPAGWTVVNRTEMGGWEFDDPGSRGNLTGGSGGFAIIDSDALGSGNTQDTDLVAPPLDLSGLSAPYVRFNSDWRAVGVGADSADIDVSSDGGTSWTNVWHQSTSRRGPRVEEVPLFPVAGVSDARVRFRFNGRFAWWWQVDNFQIVNRLCLPVPGGLVVGRTTDANTGAPLPGTVVSSVDPPVESGTSAADGFYWLFSSVVGNRQFTATKAGYPVATKEVYVGGGSTRLDFAITAPRIAVSTTSIDTFAPLGRARNANVKITNTGTAPAQVDLLEFAGGFEAMSRQGARLTEVAVPGGARKEQASDGKLPAYAPRASTLIDDAWGRIADFPVPIFDNAAATVNGKIYSVGGGSGTGRERSAYVYDPAAGSWQALPAMPSARSKPSAAAVGGKLYVFGGWGPDEVVATVDVFDPATGAWSTVPGAVNPTPRAAAGIAVAGGKVYLVAGCVDSTCPDSTDVLAFDPGTGTFTTRAAYPHLVSFQSCGGIGGRVYCAGGASTVSHKDAFVYDPATNRWTALPDLPLDLWGSAHSASSGLLILAGGVTNGFSTITNRSIAFDPSTSSWVDLPNTQFPRYRGAGSCGTYKIGGSPGGFNSTVESERLGGGLDLCDEIADVPWLSENVTAFTLTPGASRTVTVTVDASPALGINQPGTYRAKLGIRTDTPYPVPQVSVSLNVSPPTNWGKIQGTVRGVTCDGEIVSLPATVRFLSRAYPDNTYTTAAGTNGQYSYWLGRGRYDVVVSKDGWLATTQRVPIEPGVTQTLDFTLEQSCI